MKTCISDNFSETQEKKPENWENKFKIIKERFLAEKENEIQRQKKIQVYKYYLIFSKTVFFLITHRCQFVLVVRLIVRFSFPNLRFL